MFVDDSLVVRNHYRTCLQQLGLKDVLEASDGIDALRLLEKAGDAPPDLIFLDWTMPRMTGLQFLQSIRGEYPDLPVVMVTTRSEQGLVMQAVKSGITDYILKPFGTEVLGDRLKRALEKRRQAG